MFDASSRHVGSTWTSNHHATRSRLQPLLRLFALVMLMAASMGLQAAILYGSNTAGNNQRGNMFDLFVNQNVAITHFEISPMGNTT